MTESHDLDESIFGEPSALFHHVVEHHGDLRHRPADVDEAKEEKIKKHFPPRRHSIAGLGGILTGHELTTVLYLVDLRLLRTIVLKTKSHRGLSVRKRLLINKSYETKPYC